MQKRYILWCLLMLQVICGAFIATSMNIAIVSMVNTNRNPHNTTSEEPSEVCPNSTLFVREFFKDTPQPSDALHAGYDWTEAEENTALSAYTWLSFLSVLVGAVLAQKFGPKRVLGISLFTASILSSLIPPLAHHGSVIVAWIRALQGFFAFMSLPVAFSMMIGNWSPPQERGRFEITFNVGYALGNSVADLCFGYISHYIHWTYVFHITSIYGTIVGLLWFLLIHDSPESHPTITFEEKKFIRDSLGESLVQDKVSIPWKKILTSMPACICITAYTSGMLTALMIPMYFPVYFKAMYGFNANESGILTGIWRILACLTGLIGGYTSDMIVKRKPSTMTNVRKIGAFLGCILPSILLLVVAYTKCDVNTVLVCISLHSVLIVYFNYGPGLAIVDISPEYCGILMGIANSLCGVQGVLFTILINYSSSIWKTQESWMNIFAFSSLYVIILNCVFLVFGTSDVQRWDFQREDKPKNHKSPETNSIEFDSMIKPNGIDK